MDDFQTERKGFPGGLRAQLLVGLAVLLIGTVALVALLVVQLAKRQIIGSELDRTTALADQLATLHRQGLDVEGLRAFKERTDLTYAAVHSSERERPLRAGGVPGPKGDDYFEGIDTGDHKIIRMAGVPYILLTTGPEASDDLESIRVARTLGPAYDQVRNTRNLMLVYLGLDAFFILIVGYGLLTYLVVRPVRAIGVATQRAADGDLASHIELQPGNELGQVARSFNQMLDELRDNRQTLQERLEELDAAYTELEQTQESLIRSEKLASVGQLAAGVAHEIGNPLSAISGYADLMADDDLDAEQRRDLVERIRKQTDRIQSIIRDLLDFSRESDADQPIEPTKLARCVDEAIDLVEPQPRTRKVAITADLPDALPKVRANADQCVQVLVNLLINAADAIREEAEADGRTDDPLGHVTVSAEVRDDETVRLKITDDGPGIPEEDRQTIFDPFFTTKDPGEGTGLGLAISARILERFGGEITVESEVGEGTTFVLEFEAVG